MGGIFRQYLRTVQDLLAQIEQEPIEKAADVLIETIKKDKLIYLLGTSGHSYLAAEELFFQVGGLIPINPIFPSGLALAHGAQRSAIISDCSGYIGKVLEYYAPGADDTLLVVNAEGINCATIEAVTKGKELGAKVIAITSPTICKTVTVNSQGLDVSGKYLGGFDVVDVAIDIKMPESDPVIALNGLDTKVCPVSTILYMFVLHALEGCVVEKLLKAGIEPPVWRPADMPGGGAYNQNNIKKYEARIRRL